MDKERAVVVPLRPTTFYTPSKHCWAPGPNDSSRCPFLVIYNSANSKHSRVAQKRGCSQSQYFYSVPSIQWKSDCAAKIIRVHSNVGKWDHHTLCVAVHLVHGDHETLGISRPAACASRIVFLACFNMGASIISLPPSSTSRPNAPFSDR